MNISNEYYLIVDVEGTCSNDGTVGRHEMEIIEMGAVMQNSRTFEIDSDFQTLVRPVRNPRLTAFCTDLIIRVPVDELGVFPVSISSRLPLQNTGAIITIEISDPG